MGRLAKLAAGCLGVFALWSCAAKAPIETAAAGTSEAATRLVIDVRDPGPFAAGHLPGALNIQLSWGQLEGRTRSYVPDLARPIAVRADSLSDAEESAAILLELGYTDFVRVEPEVGQETATLALISARELAGQIGEVVVLDIRTNGEFAKGVIDGALRIDEDGGPAAVRDLDPAGHYAIICAGGWRSSQLATWMRNRGFTDVTNVIDGMSGWYELD